MREGHSVFDVEHTYKVTTWLARLSWLHAAATADDAIEIRGNGISSSRICGRQEGGRWAPTITITPWRGVDSPMENYI